MKSKLNEMRNFIDKKEKLKIRIKPNKTRRNFREVKQNKN
jgi:hypothetical protein